MIKFQIRMYATDKNPTEAATLLATIAVPPREAATLDEARDYASRIITSTEGLDYDVVDLEVEAAEEAFHAAEQARGELAYAPDKMHCYRCEGENVVVARGPVVERRNPTQTYRLSCGHLGS